MTETQQQIANAIDETLFELDKQETMQALTTLFAALYTGPSKAE